MASLLSFPIVWIRRTLSLSVNVLLSSVATFCPHFLFTENPDWELIWFLISAKSTKSWFFFEFVERPVSKYMLITHAILLGGSSVNGVLVCMFERRKDYTICYRLRHRGMIKGLRYSPLHVTEFCGEMQGKFKVGLARLINHKKSYMCHIKFCICHRSWFLQWTSYRQSFRVQHWDKALSSLWGSC